VGASNDSTEGRKPLPVPAFPERARLHAGRTPARVPKLLQKRPRHVRHTYPRPDPKGVALVDGSPYPPAQSTIGGIVSPSALASGVEGGIWRRAGAASSPRPPRNISPFRFLPDYQQGPVSGTSCSPDIHGCIRARTSAVTAPRVASERDKLVQDRPAAGDVGRSNA